VSEHVERLQAGLAVLAKHDLAMVVQALEQWSSRMVQAVSKTAESVGVVTRKRVAVRSCCCPRAQTVRVLPSALTQVWRARSVRHRFFQSER
jgi:hypothetical protein